MMAIAQLAAVPAPVQATEPVLISALPLFYLTFDGTLEENEGREATINNPGGVTYGTGVVGQSAKFSSSNSYAQYSCDGVFSAESGSIEALIKFDGQYGGDAVIWQTNNSRYALYYDKASDGSERRITARAGQEYATKTAGPANYAFDQHFGDASYSGDRDTLSLDDWHYVAMTWFGSTNGTVNLYIDGALANTNHYDTSGDCTTFRVGNNYWPGLPFNNGWIDELKLYSHTRSAEAIKTTYTAYDLPSVNNPTSPPTEPVEYPDLSISKVAYHPATPVAGEKFTADVYVKNTGAAVRDFGSNARILFVFGPDQQLVNACGSVCYDTPGLYYGDYRINSQIPSIGEGETKVFTFSSAVFSGDLKAETAGHYYLRAYVDYVNNVIQESNEENNRFTDSVYVTDLSIPEKPDLQITKILRDPNSTYLEHEFGAYVYIKNTGTEAAHLSGSHISLAYGTDLEVLKKCGVDCSGRDNMYYGYYDLGEQISSLVAGEEKPFVFKTTVFNGILKPMLPAKHYLYAKVDVNSKIAESNEDNNSYTDSYTVINKKSPFDIGDDESAIISIEPDSGPVGATVVIRGRNFHESCGGRSCTASVYFGNGLVTNLDTSSNYINWSDREITVRVPKGAATGTIRVSYYNDTNDLDTGGVVSYDITGPIFYVKQGSAEQIVEIENKAKLLQQDDLGSILAELRELRNQVREQQSEIKYLRNLTSGLQQVTEAMKDRINNFITYGVDDNTQRLGEGERAAVMYSYRQAYQKLPESETELADAIKIANGRWPGERNEAAENRAKEQFARIYKRAANMDNPNDNAAVTVMAYGLRQRAENRNLESEKNGIKIFEGIYGHVPSSTEEWNIMQAITYSGASR